MALLVTGAMGLVGLEVVRQAVALGTGVVAQYRNTWREEQAKALGARIAWVQLDLADAAAVARLAATKSIDGCIHSAAVPSNLMARKDPAAAFRANVQAVENLLETAKTRGWRRFVNVGSGSVFQDWPDGHKPIPEGGRARQERRGAPSR